MLFCLVLFSMRILGSYPCKFSSYINNNCHLLSTCETPGTSSTLLHIKNTTLKWRYCYFPFTDVKTEDHLSIIIDNTDIVETGYKLRSMFASITFLGFDKYNCLKNKQSCLNVLLANKGNTFIIFLYFHSLPYT